LPKIHSFYKYSLESFIDVINRAIDQITEGLDGKEKMYEVDENGNAIIPEVKKKNKNKKKAENAEESKEEGK
jgi:dynein heavy chain